MKLRKHQQDFNEVCSKIHNESKISRILALVTPGGGKSFLPVTAAEKLIPSHIDKIAWFTPRISLCTQAEHSFAHSSRRIRRSEHGYDPSRGADGFSATYNSTFNGCEKFIDDFKKYRYAVFLDECHHLEDDGHSHRSIQPLLDLAKLTIFMSGNINRNQKTKVAGLRYKMADDGQFVFAEQNTDDTEIIRYTRKDAILEKAVLKAYFEYSDGKAHWCDSKGQEREEPSLATLKGDDARSALNVVLKTEFAYGLIDKALAAWLIYRKDHPRSKFIILAPDINTAKTYVKYIKRRGHHVDFAVSTDEDDPSASKKALETIKKFKRVEGDRLDILVAVGMAHEGLDVRSASHLAILTRIRSWPWLDQAIARITRFDHEDGPYESQMPVVYIPEDEMAIAAVAQIDREQLEAIREREEAQGNSSEKSEPSLITPIHSEITRSRSATLTEALDYERTALINEIGRVHGINAPAIAIHTMMEEIRRKEQAATTISPQSPQTEAPSLRDEEDELKRTIQKLGTRLDKQEGVEFGTNAKRVYQYFGSTTTMSVEKLREVMQWLQSQIGVPA